MRRRSTQEIRNHYEWLWKWVERPKRIVSSFVRKLFHVTNAKRIQREANRWRNELVLDYDRTVRLLGWTDQYKEDYYWIFLTRDRETGKPEVQLSSCVGSPTRLRRRLSAWEYSYIDNIACMNLLEPERGISLCEEKAIIIK